MVLGGIVSGVAGAAKSTARGGLSLARGSFLLGWSACRFLAVELIRALFTYLVVVKVLQQQGTM